MTCGGAQAKKRFYIQAICTFHPVRQVYAMYNICTVRSEKYACTKFPVRNTNFCIKIRMSYKFYIKIRIPYWVPRQACYSIFAYVIRSCLYKCTYRPIFRLHVYPHIYAYAPTQDMTGTIHENFRTKSNRKTG